MNAPGNAKRKMWLRETPDRTGPVRGAGGFYRTAENQGRTLGGIPLQTTSDAVVAAVRMAYKVAETQIDRSYRLARRLRDAGDTAVGPGSDRKALDAAEKLVTKSILSSLAWWEGSVAEGRCPFKRLAAAEYQMIGSILGFDRSPRTPPAEGNSNDEQAPRTAPRSTERAAGPREPAPEVPVQISHSGPVEARRYVHVLGWKFTAPSFKGKVHFKHKTATGDGAAFPGNLSLDSDPQRIHLTVNLQANTLPGTWWALVCDKAGLQLGFIEIEL